jgi:hypothetical protein
MTSYSCSSTQGRAVTSETISSVGSLKSKQSPIRSSDQCMSPDLEISPVDDRLALKIAPPIAARMNTAGITQRMSRRQSGRGATGAWVSGTQ